MITNVDEFTRHKSALAMQLNVFNERHPHIPCAMRSDLKNVIWSKMKLDKCNKKKFWFEIDSVIYIYDNLKKAYEWKK